MSSARGPRRWTGWSRGALSAVLAAALVAGTAPGAAGAPATALGTEPREGTSSFVQEGTPVPVGGRLVPWGDVDFRYINNGFPNTAPEGVTDVAVVDGQRFSAVLRSDGTVDGFSSGAVSVPHMPDVPPDVSFTAMAMSTGSDAVLLLLRSDGRLATAAIYAEPPTIPGLPEGMTYRAVGAGNDVYYAVRSDGALVPFGPHPAACASAWVPPRGTEYVAVSAAGRAWMALRSDGVVVSCGLGTEPEGVEELVPDEGTHFVGVDAAGEFGYAARSDGLISTVGDGPRAVQPPEGRSVVSLEAGSYFGEPFGVAVLDDGSWYDWGSDRLPALSIPEQNGLVAVGSADMGQQWAIMSGPVAEAEVRVDMPSAWRYREDVVVDVEVEGPGGFRPEGEVSVLVKDPEGESSTWLGDGLLVDGRVSIELQSWLEPGMHTIVVHTQVHTVDAPKITAVPEVLAPSPTAVHASVPGTWHFGETVEAQFEVRSVDGTPLGGDAFELTSSPAGVSVGGGFTGSHSTDLSSLPPGTYDLRFAYEGWSEADSSEWSGSVVVLPPAAATVTVAPVSWTYDWGRATVEAAVSSAELRPAGEVVFLVDGTEIGRGTVVDGRATAQLDTTTLAGGDYELVAEYSGGGGVASATGSAALTVHRAPSAMSAVVTTSGRTYGGPAPAPLRFGVPWTLDYRALTLHNTDALSRVVLDADYTILVDGRVVATQEQNPGAPDTTARRFSGRELSVGNHTLTVRFHGNDRYEASERTIPVTVGKAQPTVSASLVTSPWRYGTTHKLAVTVSAPGVTPTGTVAVYKGSTKVGSATLSGGNAAVAIGGKTLPVGSQTLSVRYLGSSTVAPKSVSKSVRVSKAVATTNASFVDNTVRKPARAKLKIAVTTPSSLTPTGTVLVKVDGRTVTRTYLSSGERGRTSVLLPGTLAPGKHQVVAVYQGTARIAADASPVRQLTLWRAL